MMRHCCHSFTYDFRFFSFKVQKSHNWSFLLLTNFLSINKQTRNTGLLEFVKMKVTDEFKTYCFFFSKRFAPRLGALHEFIAKACTVCGPSPGKAVTIQSALTRYKIMFIHCSYFTTVPCC